MIKTLGRPSFTGQFDANDWYYLAARHQDRRRSAAARVTDQTLLHVRFDAAGNVASVGQTGKELIASINPVNDKTPTLGRKRSFFDELFGNIGVLQLGRARRSSPNRDRAKLFLAAAALRLSAVA